MKDCRDCGVKPGEFHVSGCDTERCRACGGQAISCGCSKREYKKAEEKYGRLPWSGEWPGAAECRQYGLWVRWGPPWIPCAPNHDGAREDLNELAGLGSYWNQEKGRVVLPVHVVETVQRNRDQRMAEYSKKEKR